MKQASTEQLRQDLKAWILQADLPITDDGIEKLLAYLAQLHKWNQAYNLSGIKRIEDMLPLHIVDSLMLLPFITSTSVVTSVADVGTGAGLPGIPLAICLPQVRFFLIDSNSKKTRFIFQTCAQLGIHNVEVVHSRAEDYAFATQVDIVTSRAFSALRDFVTATRHLLKPGGVFLAMKGQYPEQELAALPDYAELQAVHSLHVPGVNAQRHLVQIGLKSS